MSAKRLRDMDEVELGRLFSGLAREIENRLPPGPSDRGRELFVLLAFDGDGLAQYVSNADREDMVRALRETVGRLERREDVLRSTPGGAA